MGLREGDLLRRRLKRKRRKRLVNVGAIKSKENRRIIMVSFGRMFFKLLPAAIRAAKRKKYKNIGASNTKFGGTVFKASKMRSRPKGRKKNLGQFSPGYIKKK